MNYARYICTICSFVYENDTNFEALPKDWLCPTCSSGKEMFLGCTCLHYDIFEHTHLQRKVNTPDNGKHLCSACDYVYDDAKNAQNFQSLDDSWSCPSCGVSKEFFETCTCVRIEQGRKDRICPAA